MTVNMSLGCLFCLLWARNLPETKKKKKIIHTINASSISGATQPKRTKTIYIYVIGNPRIFHALYANSPIHQQRYHTRRELCRSRVNVRHSGKHIYIFTFPLSTSLAADETLGFNWNVVGDIVLCQTTNRYIDNPKERNCILRHKTTIRTTKKKVKDIILTFWESGSR